MFPTVHWKMVRYTEDVNFQSMYDLRFPKDGISKKV